MDSIKKLFNDISKQLQAISLHLKDIEKKIDESMDILKANDIRYEAAKKTFLSRIRILEKGLMADESKKILWAFLAGFIGGCISHLKNVWNTIFNFILKHILK